MADPEIREFRLAKGRPDGVHPFLTDAGAFLGDGLPLLEHDAGGRWRPRSESDLDISLGKAFGAATRISWRMESLSTIAKALNRGDRSLAAIALVQAEFPSLAKAKPAVDTEPRDEKGRWTISTGGRRFMQHFEAGPNGGVALTTYKDKAGYDTIGWGHKLVGTESYPNGITSEKAEQLFDTDLRRFKDAVNDYVKVPLNQSQFDALTSLAFNIGDDAFEKSTLLRLLNQGDYTNAGKEFMNWTRVKNSHPQGQITRRRAEQAMFNNGIYPQ